MADRQRDELFAAIDAEAGDERDRTGSRVLFDALTQRKDQIKTESTLPADKELSEKILAEARTRSAHISASRGGTSNRIPVRSIGIPWWVWGAWILAVAGVILAYRILLP